MSDMISMQPSMDSEGFKAFVNHLANCACLLEYGAGGSTSYAANIAKVKNIVSVDTSSVWIDKVKKSLTSPEVNLHIKHCDVGEVGDWGTPLSREKSQHFWNYSVTPWRITRQLNLVPDVVLIDGRFRVASFLYSLISARVGTAILFDDYFDRPHYFVVEKYCSIKEKHGRMALFIADKQFSPPELAATLTEYSTIWA